MSKHRAQEIVDIMNKLVSYDLDSIADDLHAYLKSQGVHVIYDYTKSYYKYYLG